MESAGGLLSKPGYIKAGQGTGAESILLIEETCREVTGT